ncbi:MAG: Rne/Rng family ribonuclease [Deltaproteobacteria bacterium]|nr:Rne/Rng family ribonuclease [Deltaproteobacteria bacterium]
MPKKILIESNPIQTRVAIIDNNVLEEFHYESKKDRRVVGNVYKGKVVRVLPGMQAAFVEIGLERTAFLYVSDVVEDLKSLEEISGEEPEEDEDFRRYSRGRRSDQIQDLLKEGQEVIVQISKEPLGTKGARLTSHISLPGRYLVLMPTLDLTGVSKKIENDRERRRLKRFIDSIRPSRGGVIARTASCGAREEDLKADLDYLLALWSEIQKKRETTPIPALLYEEPHLSIRTVRDLLTPDVRRIIVDWKLGYEEILKFVEKFLPRQKGIIEYFDRPEPIFDYYGVENKIREGLSKKVWLKSGGYLIIEETEALTVIDVNTGKFVGKKNLEDTILKTNLEAAEEVVHQLILRNIGGIIIIDFIDMNRESDRQKVFRSMREALRKDRAQTNVFKISELGLIEMTRRRVAESLTRSLTQPCATCEGRGWIENEESICSEVYREIKRKSLELKKGKVTVYLHPQLSAMLRNGDAILIKEAEKELNRKILIKEDPQLPLEKIRIQ